MKTYRHKNQYAPRIATKELLDKFNDSKYKDLSCLVFPFRINGEGRAVINQEWKDAPYELTMIADVEDGVEPPFDFEELSPIK